MNLAITDEVIETSWTPKLEHELNTYYNEKVISSTTDPATMAA